MSSRVNAIFLNFSAARRKGKSSTRGSGGGGVVGGERVLKCNSPISNRVSPSLQLFKLFDYFIGFVNFVSVV